MLSFVVGPEREARRGWEDFHASAGAGACVLPALKHVELVDGLLTTMRAQARVNASLLAWLAARTRRDDASIEGVLRNGTPAERRLLIPQAGLDSPEAVLLRWFILDEGQRDTETAGLTDDDVPGALSALANVHDASAWPAVLLVPSPGTAIAALERFLAFLEQILSKVPGFRVGMAVTEADADRFFVAVAGTRLETLLREGYVAVATTVPETPPVTSAAPMAGLVPAVVTRSLPAAAHGSVASAWAEAVAQQPARRTKSAGKDDRARSAVERFLYEVLAYHPVTAGRFQLNVPVDTRSGRLPRTEVDFLAARERLALEVDGYYHFRNADAYRHDRLKDFVLQQEGYTVVRFLAEDVMNRLDVVLDTIICALESATAREAKR